MYLYASIVPFIPHSRLPPHPRVRLGPLYGNHRVPRLQIGRDVRESVGDPLLLDPL